MSSYLSHAKSIAAISTVFWFSYWMPGAAIGAVAHGFTGTVGAPGTGSGQLSLQAFSSTGEVHAGSGVAVDAAAGLVLVADTGNRRVDVFSTTGTFVRAFGADVGGPGVNVCTVVCSVGSGGAAAGELAKPAFLAVDEAAGVVYVGEEIDGWVSKYELSGELVTGWGEGGRSNHSPTVEDGKGGVEFAETAFEAIDGLAVDAEGHLLIYNHFGTMFEFSPAGDLIRLWSSLLSAKPGGIAVRGSTAFMTYGLDGVIEFTIAGKEIGFISPREQDGGVVSGLGVDAAEGGLLVDEASKISQFSAACEASASPFGPFCAAIESFGSGRLASGAGLAVNATTHDVYVADAGAGLLDVFGAVLEGVTLPPTGIGATSAVLAGRVNPEGRPVTKCIFEYGSTTAYGHTVACEPDEEGIGSGSAPVEVRAAITGLADNATVHYRIVVAHSDTEVAANDESFITKPLPALTNLQARNVSPSSARLCGVIDPLGIDAHFRFEWGPTLTYGNVAPVPDGSVGAGSPSVEECQDITGLTESVTYHWRLVASNANGATRGTDHTFVYEAGGVPGLPDGRAYEMVTPPEKDGALIGTVFQGISPLISEDGRAVMAASIQCFAEAQSCTAARHFDGEPYLFARGGQGWVTTPLAPPVATTSANTAWAVSPEAGVALFSVPEGPERPDDFYARHADGVFEDIGPVSPQSSGALGVGPINELEKVETENLSHVVWESKTVWPLDETHTGFSLYEYDGTSHAAPALVGVTGGRGSTSLISECGTQLGTALAIRDRYGTLSADGGLVFFTATHCKTGSGTNAAVPVPADELWARIGGGRSALLSRKSTSECSTSACKMAPPGDAAFEGASRDGSHVLFTSTEELSDGASEDATVGDSASQSGCAAITSENGCNLYMVLNPGEVGGSGSVLVDVSAGDSSGAGPRVQGVMGLSADGTHVYFVARGVLTATPSASGASPVSGQDNLYVYERDAGFPAGVTRFIATLPAADGPNWEKGLGEANVSPDGRFLVFLSHGGLTADTGGVEGASQVYEYDATGGTLTRVSKGENGFNDNGTAAAQDAAIARPRGTTMAAAGFPRLDPTMAHDGNYVFFESPAALARGALNEVQIGVGRDGSPRYAENVYEYHAGHVSLISDGRDVGQQNDISDVELLGSDATGNNVFFTTATALVASDRDTERDYYDARICSADDPCLPSGATQESSCIAPEACRYISSEEPVFGTFPSEVFVGPGNYNTVAPSHVAARRGARRVRCAGARHAATRLRRGSKVCANRKKGARGTQVHAGDAGKPHRKGRRRKAPGGAKWSR